VAILCLRLKSSLHSILYRTNWPCRLLVASQHGPRRKQFFHCYSPTVALLGICCIATGTCLPSRCRETALVNMPNLRSLHSNGSTRYSIIQAYLSSSMIVIITDYSMLSLFRPLEKLVDGPFLASRRPWVLNAPSILLYSLIVPTVQFPPASCYILFGPNVLSTLLLHYKFLIITLRFLLGPLASFPSELIWNYGSFRQLVGLLRRGISLVTRRLPTQDNTNKEDTTDRRPCLEWDLNSLSRVWTGENISCLRPRCHYDRRQFSSSFEIIIYDHVLSFLIGK
jgi:hypothetical protein